MRSKAVKTAGIIITVVLIIIAFAGVRSSQKDRSNRIIDRERVEYMDKYLPNEVMTTWYGQVGLTNVEEYGANNGKVGAKIHYKNTTGLPLDLAPSDFGVFLDEDYYYHNHGVRDRRVRYEPGDSGEFEIHINRREGLKGLYYVLKEPSRDSMLDSRSEVPYIAGIDLSIMADDVELKKELYGIGDNYSEEYYEDSIGKDRSLVSAITAIEDVIMYKDAESKLAEEQKERQDELNRRRREALESLNKGESTIEVEEEGSNEEGTEEKEESN